MDKKEIMDKLSRAYQMEEEMVSELIKLINPESLPHDLPPAVRKRVEGILLSLRSDSLRHKEIVAAGMERLRGRG